MIMIIMITMIYRVGQRPPLGPAESGLRHGPQAQMFIYYDGILTIVIYYTHNIIH